MSTLIMSSGVFCSEPTFDIQSNAFFDVNDSPLYTNEFDLQAKTFEPSLLKFNQISDSPSSKPSPPTLLSPDFMTSSYCQISTRSSTPIESIAPEPFSSISSNLEETMTHTVTSMLDQKWTSPYSYATNNEQPCQVSQTQMCSDSNRMLMGSNLPMSASFPAHSVQQLHQIEFEGLDNKMVSQASDNVHVSADHATPYSGQSFLNKQASFEQSNLDRYVLSPISETSEVSISSITHYDQPMLSTSQSPPSYVHPSKDIALDRLSHQGRSSLPSSPFSVPFDPSSCEERFSVANVVVPDSLDFSSPDLLNNKQFRHHSYTEGLQQSNVSSPSFMDQQVLVNPTNPFYPDANVVQSNEMSPCQFMKNIPYSSDDLQVKEELRSSLMGSSSLSINQNQQQFNQFNTSNSETPRVGYALNTCNVSSPCSYDHSNIFTASSQINSTLLSSDCHPTTGNYPTFKQQVISNQQIPSDFENCLSKPNNIFEPFSQNSSSFYNSQFSTPSLLPEQFPCSFDKMQNVSASSGQQLKQLQIPSSKSPNQVSSKGYFSNAQQRHHPYTSSNTRLPKSNLFSKATTSRPSSEGLCAVCGDNAACQHYGVRTCEGCKGFFKRTVQKKSTYVCLANKNCPVDKRRRNRCQFCRFEKCLAVGMVKDVVRKDDLKGRRGRLPSKAKGPKDLVGPPSTPVSFITSLVRAHIDTNPTSLNIDTSQFRAPGMPPCTPIRSVQEETQEFYDLLTSCLLNLRHWAEKIPGFCSLSQNDQDILIESSFLEIFAFRLAYRMEIQEGKFIFCNGLALHRDQLYPSFGNWTDDLTSFACKLADLNVDLSSFSSLMALLLFQDRTGLKNKEKVKKLQTMVVESLKKHVSTSAVTADRPNLFMKLIAFMPDVTVLGANGSRRLQQLKVDSPGVALPQTLHKTIELHTDRL